MVDGLISLLFIRVLKISFGWFFEGREDMVGILGVNLLVLINYLYIGFWGVGSVYSI